MTLHFSRLMMRMIVLYHDCEGRRQLMDSRMLHGNWLVDPRKRVSLMNTVEKRLIRLLHLHESGMVKMNISWLLLMVRLLCHDCRGQRQLLEWRSSPISSILCMWSRVEHELLLRRLSHRLMPNRDWRLILVVLMMCDDFLSKTILRNCKLMRRLEALWYLLIFRRESRWRGRKACWHSARIQLMNTRK